jgi:hypothetical protein
MTDQRRRFPPPWSVEETQPCFIVRDSNGQALAFVYFEDSPAGAQLQVRLRAMRRGGSQSHRQAGGPDAKMKRPQPFGCGSAKAFLG